MRLLPAFLALLALAAPVAAPVAAAEKHGHGAHVHGAGKLNVAIENDVVAIELSAPADDIVGFEHKAATPEQKAAVAKAAAALKDGARLFVFPAAAGCKLESAQVESALLEEAKPGESGEHTDFDADYRFRCADSGKIDGIDVKIFAAFPRAKSLAVQAATPKGQISRKLSPKNARLRF
ncbi:MAG: DUF2796 domain-containing protein [Alphaproteobacteria bacterium]|nr:DUF2796 domain-containing protein [Alphaproteobacteria bacterium]